MSKTKQRLDILLVDRRIVESRSRAQALIMAGEVKVNGELVLKSGTSVPINAEIEVAAPVLYVSRGGYKLAGALAHFDLIVKNRRCADVGACTGGFTDVLLQQGAACVYAIDVGYGQLDWKLRQHKRVVVMERTNARYLETLPEPIDFVCIDVAFISLRHILPAVQSWVTENADIVALIKPQYEAGAAKVGKGGVVRDPTVHEEVLRSILGWATYRGLRPAGLIRSPIDGASGNIEYLVWLKLKNEKSFDLEAAIEKVMGS